MQMRVTVACLVLLAGCTGTDPAPAPPQDAPGPEPAVEPETWYHNVTARSSGLMGTDGTLILTSGPGPASVPEQIHTVSQEGWLMTGSVQVSWSSTSVPGLEMTLVLIKDDRELERVQSAGTLALELPAGAQGSVLRLQPAGPAGAHLLVRWDMELVSRWAEWQP